MLEDLIRSLQQSAELSRDKRALSYENTAAMNQPSVTSFPMVGGGGNNGGPGGRGYHGQNPVDVANAQMDADSKKWGSSVGGSSMGGKSSPRLSAFLKAISSQESGGNYKAVGVQTSSGRAYGKYQILDSNFVGPGGWDKEALGREVTLKQYLNNPKIQEAIARGKLTDYFKQYGARGAAKAWYAGPGNANTNSNSPQYGGPSINAYAASVIRRMRGYL